MRRKVNPSKALFEKKKKLKTLSQLKKICWTWFSQYIRLRDCLKTTGTLHEGRCYTCDTIYPMKKLQAGHFLPGRKNAVLFQEDQVHAQCFACNVWNHGSWPEYYEHMTKDWGIDRIQMMLIGRHDIKKFTRYELEQLIETYKQKITNLSKQ